MRSVACLALLVVGVSASLAQSPVGKWTGKIEIKMPKLPENMPADQKKMMGKMLAQMKEARILLEVKADKSFTATTKNIPGAKPNDTNTGTWSQAGKVITLNTKPKPGRPANAPNTQTLTLAANGKVMVMNIPGGQGSVTFTR